MHSILLEIKKKKTSTYFEE